MQIGAEGHQYHRGTAGIAERVHDPWRYRQPQYVSCRDVDVLDLPVLLEPDAARPHHGGGFHRGPMHVIAANLVGLREDDVHVFLVAQFGVRQGFEQGAACVAVGFYRLNCGTRRMGIGHAADYNVIACGVFVPVQRPRAACALRHVRVPRAELRR